MLDVHNLPQLLLSFPNAVIGNPAYGRKQERHWIPDKLVLMEMRNGETFGNDK
ncbi:MAG: hypothetical protein JETT_0516 [Candidatus Jettenia ecosi]|uniref:Uncharacterized protein n=1 Tax=Candidatus Jettenia ecosi TaxID=2494326 RepID=A0A533QF16_9BACT|nr:MAG: hypothetical protein JETT_0516 [Candidatus Jettenia ecosi]